MLRVCCLNMPTTENPTMNGTLAPWYMNRWLCRWKKFGSQSDYFLCNTVVPVVCSCGCINIDGVYFYFTTYVLCVYTNTAVCSNPCQNGGTCTAPNTCACDVGWTGTECETATGGCNLFGNMFTWCVDSGICQLVSIRWLYNIFAALSPPVVDCEDPGFAINGERTLSSTTYNSVVTYTCHVGYTLQGTNTRTCQSNGQWSGSVPQCIRMFCKCTVQW